MGSDTIRETYNGKHQIVLYTIKKKEA